MYSKSLLYICGGMILIALVSIPPIMADVENNEVGDAPEYQSMYTEYEFLALSTNDVFDWSHLRWFWILISSTVVDRCRKENFIVVVEATCMLVDA